MTLFVVDNADAPILTLPQDESKHCVKVLRMGVGQELYATDGSGTLCRCRILNPDQHACEVEVVERRQEYLWRKHRLHVAVAPTKNNARLEWFLEKAVEIGVDEITPILCDHSERTALKQERIDKIVVSAMKQSLKAYKPVVHAPVRLLDLLSAPSTQTPGAAKLICHCEGDERMPLQQLYDGQRDALVLIGPEGDFSPREVEAALQAGFHPITLGPCRLRTETAALYATVAINLLIDSAQ